jgi:twinkle protein
MTDIVKLKRMLASQAQAVAEHLLPAGKREGHEWRVGSVSGEAGKSLGVHLSGQKAGVWSDFGTGESGDLIDLWMTVKRLELPASLDEIRAYLGVERPRLHRPTKAIWKRPAKPKCSRPQGRAFAYLTEDRNLPAQVLVDYKIGEDEQDGIVFPFSLPDGTMAMAKRQDSVDGAKLVPTTADCEPILFGWQAIPANARSVVITEGEIDALSWAAYGHPAMSVPFGGGGGGKQRWIESEYDRMERFERIYIATDMDGPGDDAALEIANRLGRHRCVRVKMPRIASASVAPGCARA